MPVKSTIVFGIYASRCEAESAVDKIVEFRTTAGGFTHNDISVLLPDIRSSKRFADEKHTKAPEGTTTGLIGGTLGLLGDAGVLAIPGLGEFFVAGPIADGLIGLGGGGAAGGLLGALVRMDIPEYEAKRCEGHLKDGGVLLSVHCETPDQISRAKNLLEQAGAVDISSACEKPVSSHGITDTAA